MAEFSVVLSSELGAPVARVWDVVATMRGINDELAPWFFMTSPAEASGMNLEDAPTGAWLFRSWVLFLGVLPIDCHHFRLTRVEPGRGFDEDSVSWTEKRWQHRRVVRPMGESACALTDELRFTPRVGAMGPLLRVIVAALFRHRHRQLRRRFGDASRSLPRLHASSV